MRRTYTLLLLALLASAMPATQLWSQPLQYVMTVGTGAANSMTGATTLIQNTRSGRWNSGFQDRVFSIPIGFTFNFDGVGYTSLWACTDGIITLGSSPISDGGHTMTGRGATSYPLIAPFWQQLILSGTSANLCRVSPMLSYITTGSSPNRVLTIEWHDVELGGSPGTPAQGANGSWSTFQVRLYETSSKIEFFYTTMNPSALACSPYNGNRYSTAATIGIAQSPSRYLSVSLASGSPVASTTTVNDNNNVQANRINANDIYTFTPCALTITGITGPNNGAPATQLNNGDVLFSGTSVQFGNSKVFKPFFAKMTDASCNRTYTLTITGPAAADYYFGTPGTQTISRSLNGGIIDTTAITFKPTGGGPRSATLTITDPNGFSRTLALGGSAPFINYTGNLAQGAQTVPMTSGDTLFLGTAVPRFSTQNFQPFTLTNIGGSAQPLSYSIVGGSGQYTISPPQTPLAGGASTTPTITFSPVGYGVQPAKLTVTAAGTEIRTFVLYAISAAPGGTFILNSASTPIDSNTILFNNQYSCVGEVPFSYPVSVTNVGYGAFLIKSIEAYATDTTYRQGTPSYPLLRDASGRLVRLNDYVITDQPLTGPITPAQLPTFPISVPQGATRTLYITFVGARPEKRFAQVVIRTNGQNSSGRDTNGVLTEGIINFNVYGRGVGSRLSDNLTGGLPKPIIYQTTKVGDSTKLALTFANPGQCSLRISLSTLEIISGDRSDFKIVKLPTTGIDPVTNDLVIAPNTTNSSIEILFKPTQSGSRRASLVLRTNDSTVFIPGQTDRGVYYLDLFGKSPTILTASNLDLGSALIGGGPAEQPSGVVHLENTDNQPVSITQIQITGTDAADFVADPNKAWPTLPKLLLPGDRLDLGLVFAPAAGTPGPRTVVVKFTLSSGDVVTSIVTGVAGTREIVVTPLTLNFDAKLTGKGASGINRQSITITNTGTLPLTLTQPVLSNNTNNDFSIGSLPRLVLNPGQSEFLEIAYKPLNQSTITTSLTIGSNAGPKVVTLNGTAQKARLIDDNPTQTIGHNNGNDPILVGLVNASGVDGEVTAGGVTLRQSVPNPGQDLVSIGYRIPVRGDVRLELFDGNGQLVRVLDAGMRDAGEKVVSVDVSHLASGVYHYRLTGAGQTLNRTMNIVR